MPLQHWGALTITTLGILLDHFSPQRPLWCLFSPLSSWDWTTATLSWQVFCCMPSDPCKSSRIVLMFSHISSFFPHTSLLYSYYCHTTVTPIRCKTPVPAYKAITAPTWNHLAHFSVHHTPFKLLAWLKLTHHPLRYKDNLHQDFSLFWQMMPWTSPDVWTAEWPEWHVKMRDMLGSRWTVSFQSWCVRSWSNGKLKDLVWKHQIVMARWLGQSVFKITSLVECSHHAVVSTYQR